MTTPALRWAVSPHDGACHALEPATAALAAVPGYAEALCAHTMPGEHLRITEAPTGALCLACAMGAAATLPDPPADLGGWGGPP